MVAAPNGSRCSAPPRVVRTSTSCWPGSPGGRGTSDGTAPLTGGAGRPTGARVPTGPRERGPPPGAAAPPHLRPARQGRTAAGPGRADPEAGPPRKRDSPRRLIPSSTFRNAALGHAPTRTAARGRAAPPGRHPGRPPRHRGAERAGQGRGPARGDPRAPPGYGRTAPPPGQPGHLEGPGLGRPGGRQGRGPPRAPVDRGLLLDREPGRGRHRDGRGTAHLPGASGSPPSAIVGSTASPRRSTKVGWPRPCGPPSGPPSRRPGSRPSWRSGWPMPPGKPCRPTRRRRTGSPCSIWWSTPRSAERSSPGACRPVPTRRVLAAARKASGYVPELARLMGIPIPPPPGPRRPVPARSVQGRRAS